MCPQRWLTPLTGRDHAVPSPSATPTPTSRQPARPGPRVTAMRPTSSGPAPACSNARSRRWGRRSRWSRAASSGTTPPNSRCRSTCEWMTLASTRRPLSTSATDVSSHDVSMPSVSASLFLPTRRLAPPSPHGAGGDLSLTALVLCAQFAPQTSYVRVDTFQVGFVRAPEAGRVDGVGPHHDRVLAVVRVVALAPPDHLEAEGLVHVHRVLVGRAHLERDPLGAHVVRGLDETGEDDAPVTVVVELPANADRRHVGLVVHAPHAAVAHD